MIHSFVSTPCQIKKQIPIWWHQTSTSLDAYEDRLSHACYWWWTSHSTTLLRTYYYTKLHWRPNICLCKHLCSMLGTNSSSCNAVFQYLLHQVQAYNNWKGFARIRTPKTNYYEWQCSRRHARGYLQKFQVAFTSVSILKAKKIIHKAHFHFGTRQGHLIPILKPLSTMCSHNSNPHFLCARITQKMRSIKQIRTISSCTALNKLQRCAFDKALTFNHSNEGMQISNSREEYTSRIMILIESYGAWQNNDPPTQNTLGLHLNS